MAVMNETCLLEDNCGDETGNKIKVKNLTERVFDVTSDLMRLCFFLSFSHSVEKMCTEFLWARYNLRRVDRNGSWFS